MRSALLVSSLLAAACCADAFKASGVAGRLPSAGVLRCPTSAPRSLALRMQQQQKKSEGFIDVMSEWGGKAPEVNKAQAVAPVELWDVAEDEEGRRYYWNTETGETAWEKPSPASTKVDAGVKAPKQIYYAVDEEARDQRWERMQKVMEMQKEADEAKATKGFVSETRKFEAIGWAGLFIGLPVLLLFSGVFTGFLPDPNAVCVQGGTNC